MVKDKGSKSESIPNDSGFDDDAVSALADFMLLALIRAYPSELVDEKLKIGDERDRLAKAKLAIFGTPIVKGKRSYLDLMAMAHMANSYIEDRGAPNYDLDYTMSWPETANDAFSSSTALANKAYGDLVEKGSLEIDTSNKAQLVRTWQKKFEAKKNDWLRLGNGRDKLASGSLRSFTDDLRPILAKRGIKLAEISEPFEVFNRPI